MTEKSNSTDKYNEQLLNADSLILNNSSGKAAWYDLGLKSKKYNILVEFYNYM